MVSAATPLILGVTMLVYLRQRKVYRGFGHWVLANFGLSLGYLLVSLRGFVPDLLSIILGNALVVYSAILVYEGIERFYGRPPFDAVNYSALGVFLVLQTYFTYADPSINARVALASLVLSLLICRAGLRLFAPSIPQLRRTSRSAGVLFMVTGLFPLVRGVAALAQSQTIQFFSDPLNSWFSVVFIMSIIGWSFYFFFLNSARLELDLQSALAELEHLAGTDPLTGVFNRRHFEKHAGIEFERAQRYRTGLSFVLIDLDDFKCINDTYGHEAGDRVLASLTRELKAALRSSDVLARLGGDEFVVMLVNVDVSQVHRVAERIHRAIGDTSLDVDGQPLQVRASLGIATVQADDVDLATMLKRGDRALYRAKEQGRDRIVEG